MFLLRIFLVLAALGLVAIETVHAQRAQDLPHELKVHIETDAPLVAIENVRVVDGTGVPARDAQTILIRNGRLAEIGQDVVIPDGATVIDAEGLTALPGLVMMHEHFIYPAPLLGAFFLPTEHSYPALMLANGVTTARLAGTADIFTDLYFKELIDSGEWIGPDLVISFFATGPNPTFRDVKPMALTSKRQARSEVRYWTGRGAASVKAYMDLPLDLVEVVTSEAHKAGIKVAAHLCVVSAADAARAGVDSWEHGLSVMSDFLNPAPTDQCPTSADRLAALERIGGVESAEVKALINTLIEHDVVITSTLTPTAEGACVKPPPTALELKVMNERARTRHDGTIAACAKPDTEKQAQISSELKWLRYDQAFERAFVDAGGQLLAGSDNPVAGFNDHRQLILMVDGGFTPLEAIKVATHNGAAYLNRLADIGTLAEGKRADLFLVRGRPDEKIADIRNVVTVFKDGVGYRSTSIINALQETVGE